MKKPTQKRRSKYSPAPASLPSIHVKRSAELWLEIFQDALGRFLESELEAPNMGLSRQQASDNAIIRAIYVSDKALDTFEERWPGVKL